MRNLLLGRVSVLIAAVLTVTSLAPRGGAAAAAPETVLYSFCAQGGKNCTDGDGPYAGLIMDAAGKLYGTTYGGAHLAGTVFELTPNAVKTKWTETVLYSFCAQGGGSCTDGAHPYAGLIMDAAGHLYGTTYKGGAHNGGAVFELTPNAAKTKWTETVLYSFCAQGGKSCTDGVDPYAGLIMDAAGKLYGTTFGGGAHAGEYGGTVFELAPNAAKTKWTETVLYSFCTQGGKSCTDGAGLFAGLIMDAAGHLYGTTFGGGANGGGTAFELTPNAAAKTIWTHKILYSFCVQGVCPNGAGPVAGVIMDATGHLYGTTAGSGTDGGSTVFELAPNAAKTKWTETVLYGFCTQGGKSCTDGLDPYARLIMDASGRVYGTTGEGGAHGEGTVFELTPNAAKTKWTETVLYSFCSRSACTDGASPYAGLIMDASGHLYGTTLYGGAHDGGTVFALP